MPPPVPCQPMARAPVFRWPELDTDTKCRILDFLAVSPTVKDNGIARACRESNVKWRRMVRRMMEEMVRGMMRYRAAHGGNISGLTLNLDDLLDVANLEPWMLGSCFTGWPSGRSHGLRARLPAARRYQRK